MEKLKPEAKEKGWRSHGSPKALPASTTAPQSCFSVSDFAFPAVPGLIHQVPKDAHILLPAALSVSPSPYSPPHPGHFASDTHTAGSFSSSVMGFGQHSVHILLSASENSVIPQGLAQSYASSGKPVSLPWSNGSLSVSVSICVSISLPSSLSPSFSFSPSVSLCLCAHLRE